MRLTLVRDPGAELHQFQRWSAQQPGYREWWRQWTGVTYAGDFNEYMDGLIREGEAAA